MRLSIRICACAAAALLTVPSLAPAAPSRDPIRLTAILSISGRYAALGEPERDGVEMAAREINSAGGIGGRPVAVTVLDDEGKPEVASQLATQAIGGGAVGLVGGTSVASCAAMARVATESKIPLLYTTPASDIWNGRNGVEHYLFEAAPSSETEARALLAFATTKLHAHRAAVIYDENAYGTQGNDILNRLAATYNVQIVGSQSYPGAGTDFTPQIVAIKNVNPDMVLLWGAATAPPLVVRAIRQLGLKTTILGSSGILSPLFLKVSAKAGDGVYSDTSIDYTHPDAFGKRFLSQYHAAYHETPANPAAFAYDAVELMTRAIARDGGKTSSDAIVAALESMPPTPLATGVFRLSPTDHNGLAARDVHIAVDRNGVWFNI